MTFQIGRCSTQDAPAGGQFPQHQRRVRQCSELDGDVHVVGQPDEFRAEPELQAQVGVEGHEFGQQGRQLAVGKRRHGVDAQDAVRHRFQRVGQRFHIGHGIDHPLYALQIGLPFASQDDGLGGAVEQADTDTVFDARDQFADCGWGQAQRSGGGGKISAFGYRRENVELIHLIHKRLPLLHCATRARCRARLRQRCWSENSIAARHTTAAVRNAIASSGCVRV